MTWNTPYLDNTPGSTWSGSAYTTPLTGSGISVPGRASFGSNVSIRGDLVVYGSTGGASAFSGSAITGTTVAGITSVQLGTSGTPVTRLSRHTQAVAVLTVPAFDSLDTTFANNSAAVADSIVGLAAPSATSADLIPYAFVSSASVITLRAVNSTLTEIVQTAQTWSYWLMKA